MPLNSNGKVDGKKLKSGAVTGKRYSILPVYIEDRLTDIVFDPAEEGEFATVGAGVPKELEDDPYKILAEFFAAVPEMKEGGLAKALNIPGFRELVIRLTDFDIKNIPMSVWNSTPKMLAIIYKNDLLPFIKRFEDLEDIIPMLNGKTPSMMPPMPFMPVPWMGDFNTIAMRFWNQFFDMQKDAFESSRKQWDRWTEHISDMKDDPLPKGVPVPPMFVPWPLSPMSMMKQWQDLNRRSRKS